MKLSKSSNFNQSSTQPEKLIKRVIENIELYKEFDSEYTVTNGVDYISANDEYNRYENEKGEKIPYLEICTLEYYDEEIVNDSGTFSSQNHVIQIPIDGGENGWGYRYFINAGIKNVGEFLQFLSNETNTTYRLHFSSNDYRRIQPNKPMEHIVE